MRARLGAATALLVALLVAPAPAAAQGWNSIGFNTVTADVTLTTTAETVIVSSGPVTVRRDSANVCVLAFAQLTTGASTTSVTPRIRRGTTTGGTLVGEANAQTILATAGSTEKYFLLVCEDRSNVASVDYSLTLAQAGASADGTALQGSIVVMAR